VHPDPERGFAPSDSDAFEAEMGEALAVLLADPERAREMGRAGRERVERRGA
jgi:starch synthase